MYLVQDYLGNNYYTGDSLEEARSKYWEVADKLPIERAREIGLHIYEPLPHHVFKR